MTVIECGRGHGTVWSSEYQQKSQGCKYVKKQANHGHKQLCVEHCCDEEE